MNKSIKFENVDWNSLSGTVDVLVSFSSNGHVFYDTKFTCRINEDLNSFRKYDAVRLMAYSAVALAGSHGMYISEIYICPHELSRSTTKIST